MIEIIKNEFNMRKEVLMRPNPAFITIFAAIFLVLTNSVQATSLGTSSKGNYADVKRGETAEFVLLFWNMENSSYPIKLEVGQTPGNISVIIRPDEFLLNYSRVTSFPAESGRDYVNTRYGLMKMTPVRVLVKTSESIEEGEYDVFIIVTAGEPAPTGVSTLLEKTFKFTVNVTRAPTPPERITEAGKEVLERITGMVTTPVGINTVFLAFSIVVILIFSWVIYRHFKKSYE